MEKRDICPEYRKNQGFGVVAGCSIDCVTTEPTKDDPCCTNGDYTSCAIYRRGPKATYAGDPIKLY